MTKKHLIWDLPIRLFHWTFAVTIMASWYTAEHSDEFIDIHMQLGYLVLGLLLFRIIWGFIGPKHARFINFIPTPKRLLSYLQGDHLDKQNAGHNPLGALMVVFMITIILAQAVSGLFISDDVFSSGPYYGEISKDAEKIMLFIHHNSFDFILAAVVFHVIAIAFYWLVKKKNLVTPMFTGKKSVQDVKATEAIPNSKLLLACIIAILCSAFIYWLVVINAPIVEDFYY